VWGTEQGRDTFMAGAGSCLPPRKAFHFCPLFRALDLGDPVDPAHLRDEVVDGLPGLDVLKCYPDNQLAKDLFPGR
jgi:hypothetical protein